MKKHINVVSIDTAVPMPGDIRWPIEDLKVGESFPFPIEKRASIQSRASKVKAKLSRDFKVKKMDGNNGRIWRTK